MNKMLISLIRFEARALSNQTSLFFSDTYQLRVSHQSGNKLGFKLSPQP